LPPVQPEVRGKLPEMPMLPHAQPGGCVSCRSCHVAYCAAGRLGASCRSCRLIPASSMACPWIGRMDCVDIRFQYGFPTSLGGIFVQLAVFGSVRKLSNVLSKGMSPKLIQLETEHQNLVWTLHTQGVKTWCTTVWLILPRMHTTAYVIDVVVSIIQYKYACY
jgi:hypothetical protein